MALGFAAGLVKAVLAAGQGTTKMQEISGAVQEGASAYLLRQFRTLGIFVVIAVVLLFLLPVHDTDGSEAGVKIGRSAFFVVGAVFSAFIGGAGMSLATRANLRVAAAARERGRPRGRDEDRLPHRRRGRLPHRRPRPVRCALVVLIFRGDAPTVLEGFGFGAALLAMFMRVGGGIFTKAADVGADLVGKVEQGIPEDDPRNAATIADNVGDNVGDCAGMAADLFESYAVTLVAALILGRAAFGDDGLVFPLIVPTIGVDHRDRRGVHHPAADLRPERPDRDQPGVLHLRRDLRGAGARSPPRLPAGHLRRPARGRHGAAAATRATRGSSPSARW